MEKKRFETAFGNVAVEKGFITYDQLIQALEIQVYEVKTTGKHRPIGRILLNDGSITMRQIGEVMAAQGKPIISLNT